jgi:uncharacterized membrane protein
MPWVDALMVLAALTAALAVRPWRALPAGGPPAVWLAWWALLPLLWTADRLAASALAPALPGSVLLMLMAGWPLAVLALVPAALLAAAVGGLDAAQALHRLAWLGIAPATLALALGALVRRFLPHHLFVYILGRGFFAAALANTAAGVAAVALHGAPGGTSSTDLMLARGFVAWGDAILCGMLVAIFVAFRPHWLATYSDRLYLPVGDEP